MVRKAQVEGNDKEYFIEKDYINIWRFEEDFIITNEDLPFIKKAIRLLEEKMKSKKKNHKIILTSRIRLPLSESPILPSKKGQVGKLNLKGGRNKK
jgi:hypothetical protein